MLYLSGVIKRVFSCRVCVYVCVRGRRVETSSLENHQTRYSYTSKTTSKHPRIISLSTVAAAPAGETPAYTQGENCVCKCRSICASKAFFCLCAEWLKFCQRGSSASVIWVSRCCVRACEPDHCWGNYISIRIDERASYGPSRAAVDVSQWLIPTHTSH